MPDNTAVPEDSETNEKYTMTISRMTVDKLGVRLYDRVSAVLAELVANSYDADATRVVVSAPMGQYLAHKPVKGEEPADKELEITVTDDGVGMTPDEVNQFYLKVGGERRNDAKRGDVSKIHQRKVMGRKGVGKLAPFGICKTITVLTSGGELVDGLDADGAPTRGYLTAHLVLDRQKILSDEDTDYHPEVGPLDGTVAAQRGTTLSLTVFNYRQVPSIEDLSRQMAQRFGIESADWQIVLSDNTRSECDAVVGSFEVDTLANTVLRLDYEKNTDGTIVEGGRPRVFGPEGHILTDVQAGFTLDDEFYPLTGWIGYAREPYKDDLMAGVRIYCRGKIAAQTSVFNRRAGFTGEHTVRSYLVGRLNADWLDDDEDLIQTDRRDILWSDEVGKAFEEWGQSIVGKIGNVAREPMKKKTWELFREASHIEERAADAFPGERMKEVRENAVRLAELVGKTMREGEVKDAEHVESVVKLSLTLAPHLTLDETLREAASQKDSPVGSITALLTTARVAELSSFGRIADDRVKVIDTVETLKDRVGTDEAELQQVIEEAPWLINPQWSPITANQTFATLKREFAKFYKQRMGEDIELTDFRLSKKRADFVLSDQDGVLHIIEIKKPQHLFEDQEMVRLQNYVDMMEEFLNHPSHSEFKRAYYDFHVTLVCDGEKLTSVYRGSYNGLIETGRLTAIDWATFLMRTRKMHQNFMEEADRQRAMAVAEQPDAAPAGG